MTRLETYGREAINTVLESVGRGVGKVQERKPLSADLLESDDAYLVVFDAPGANKEDVQVRFVDGELEVRIDRYRAFHEGYEMRFPGRGLTLSGSVTLPDVASVTGASTTPEATLTPEGTLQVRIPKAESARAVDVDDEPAADDDTDDAADE
ncbi:MAG: molecular chaperone, small heat shock protein [Halonotius sp. J07HN4]|nr:MAG: molecular chaperone, small heat shock protein [Halonotius sp. J07HN4]